MSGENTIGWRLDPFKVLALVIPGSYQEELDEWLAEEWLKTSVVDEFFD